MPDNNRPALLPKRPRKARLTTEIDPDVLDALKNLSAYLQTKNYDAPMARLVERFIDEGIAKIMKELGIKKVPTTVLKPLPGARSAKPGKKLREGART